MNDPAVPDFVPLELERLGITLSDDVLGALARYLDLLLEMNQRMNLTAIRERDLAWRRLIIDSLTLLPGLEPLLPEAEAGPLLGAALPGAGLPGVPGGVIDIGTGGGLPGIPVAIARPDLRITLLEATGKKVRFLESCIERLPLPNVKAIQERAETLGQDRTHRQQYDIAVSRAVGPMAEVLEYSLPLVKVGGKVLAMKGPQAERELAEVGDALGLLGAGDVQVFDAYPESFGNDLVIISILKDRPTPKAYPRRPGVPHQEPLG